MKDFNLRIKTLRTFFRLSQTQFGEAVGVSKQQMSRVESGINAIHISGIYKLKKAFPQVNLNWLIAGEGDMILRDDKIDRTEYHKLERELMDALKENLRLNRKIAE